MSFAVILSAFALSLGNHTIQPVSAASHKHTIAKTKVQTASQTKETPKPVMVTVQPGDTLDKIATTNGTTYPRLYDANTQVTQPDLIYPNQQLRIPAADETLTPRPLPQPPAPQAPAAPAARQVSDPAPVSSAPAVAGGSVWDSLAACESGGNWSINTGNGFYGGLQFTLSSWQAVGGSGYPNQASREEQIYRATILQSRGGWGNWPVCAAKLGLL
jgi:LysM repeat protein